MSVTLEDLITLVNNEVENGMIRGNASSVGDGVVDTFLIAPQFRFILNNATFGAFIDGVLDTTGTMDYDSGVYTFASPPAVAAVLTWEFDYVYWTVGQATAAVNAAMGMLFPSFYLNKVEAITADGTAQEYKLTTANIEHVKSVQQTTDGVSYSTMKARRYEPYMNGSDMYLRFYSVPTSGTMRVLLICRPTPLVTTDSAIDVPERAVAPIVSYSCYYLLNQKQAPRLRSDIALATVGGGNLSPRQMNDASNAFFLRFQTQLAQVKMRPWSSI